MKTTYQIFYLLLASLFSFTSVQATNIYGGTVSGNWTLANSPYTVYGAVFVPSGSSLTIEPGTIVRFAEHARMRVEGSLKADGTVTDSIRFEYAGTNAWYNHISPSPGWWGIAISNYNLPLDSSSITYCNFQGFRQNNQTSDTTSGALNVSFSHIYFAHNRFHHNVAESAFMGITLNYATAEIAYNEITENNITVTLSFNETTVYLHRNHIHHNYNDLQSNVISAKSLTPAIMITNNSHPIVSYNDIHHHINVAGYGGGLVSQGEITLYHNRFYENQAKMAGGAVYLSSGGTNTPTNIVLNGNLFANNSDSTDTYNCGITDGGGGANISQGDCDSCKTFLHNNIFANNKTGSWGGGLRLYKTRAIVMNNDFVNNMAKQKAGALQIFNSPGKQVFAKNNIFFGNHTEDTLFYPNNSVACEGLYGTMIFEYNCMEYPYTDAFFLGTADSMLSYTNNFITPSPQFIAPTTVAGLAQNGVTANWGLQVISPCINAGDLDTTNCYITPLDYLEQIRMFSTIDVGAIEYRHAEAVESVGSNTLNVSFFPNPVNNLLHILFSKNMNHIELTIYDVLGNEVLKQSYNDSNEEYIVSVSHLQNGIYFVKIQTATGFATKQMIKY